MPRLTRCMATLLGLIVAWSAALSARAWNSPGHMIIALIAYDQMDAATKSKALALLRAHPRFDDHFQRPMPREVSRADAESQNQWLFAYAGTWPDVVRDTKGSVNHEDVTRFSRPWWHFVNEPVFLSDDERRKLDSVIRINRRREPTDDPDDPDLNIIQAVKNSSRIVGNAGAPAETRSVHLCWLIHLAGDSHQPLHAASLFTTRRFPGGDHGGNYLDGEHGWSLHSFWDEQICREQSFATLRIIATELEKNRELVSIGERAAGTVDIENWIDEGHTLALRFGYSKEVLKKVAAREGHAHLGPLELSANYKTDAEALAERRAVEAGYRLGKLLQQLLD